MQMDDSAAEARDAILHILNNDETLESYHRSEYEPFYRILDTMPETFLASIAPPDQTTARLHFNAYFLAKIVTKATSSRQCAVVTKIALYLIHRLLGEQDKAAATSLLAMVRNNFSTDSVLALPPGKPPIVKLPDKNQNPYVRSVFLQLMAEFLQMVPELEVKAFYTQLAGALPEVFDDKTTLQSWLCCARSLYELLLEIGFYTLREHLVDTFVEILRYLSEESRINEVQDDLNQLLGHMANHEILSAGNVKKIIGIWPQLKPLWKHLVRWFARSAPTDRNIHLLILPHLTDLFSGLPGVEQLIDKLEIQPEYFNSVRLEKDSLRIFNVLSHKPSLTAGVRSQTESYFHSLFPISDVKTYPQAIACCRILLNVSSGNTEQSVANVVFAPLMSVSPNAATFVRDRHRMTISMDEISRDVKLVAECLSLVPLFSETRVNQTARRSIILDAAKKRNLFAAVVDNICLYKDACDSVLSILESHRLLPEEMNHLATALLKLPCVLAGAEAPRVGETSNNGQVKSCLCKDDLPTLITSSAASEALGNCILNVLGNQNIEAEKRNMLAICSTLHLKFSQQQLDRLLDVFLAETNYLVRLGLVRALYRALESNPSLEPKVDLTQQFSDVENRDVYETSLMLVSRIVAARPALKFTHFKHLAAAACDSVMYLRTVALSEIHWLSRHSGVSLRQMILDNRQMIALCVFRAAVDSPARSLEHIVKGVSDVFDADSPDVYPCLKTLHRFLLPMFVAHGGEDAQRRVREIARLSSSGNASSNGGLVLENTHSKLLKLIGRYLPQIVAYLFTTHRRDPGGKCETFLSFAIGNDWRTAFTEGAPHRIIYEFMTYLPVDEAGVKLGISYVARMRQWTINDDMDIRTFVYEHLNLLGVLFLYDTNIRKAVAEEKLRIISSLPEFIRYLGVEHVTSVRIKLMYVLRAAFSVSESDITLLKYCADAWFVFVKSLDKSGLPTIIGDLVMSVLPLLNTPEVLAQAREILEYLLIENKQCYAERLHELAFLQEMDKLPMSIRKTFASNKNIPFKEQIGNSVVNICNESNSVRRLVLKRLARLLSENREALSELLDSETENDFISEMIRQLFACCQTGDAVIHSLVGECLSHLGALDPARIALRVSASEQEQVPIMITEDSKFAHGLLKRLVNTFLTYNHQNDMQNKASYVIQEVSKTYCLPNDKELWRLFKTHEQEVIRMLSGTKYEWISKKQDNLPVERPIFNGPLGTDFSAWINAWIKSLLPLVRNKTERYVMDLSSLIAENDLAVAQFILPSLVSTVMVTASDEEVEYIKLEAVSVLDGGAHLGGDSVFRSKEMQHMATQTVFSLLEHLLGVAKISSQKRQYRFTSRADSLEAGSSNSSSSSRGGNSQGNNDRRFKFVEGIAQDKLARAAFGCQEYSRALMHLSRYLQANPGELQNNLTFLQDIYVRLNDPDGVAGAAELRKKDASLKEKIIEHKAQGKLLDALTCYERLLGSSENQNQSDSEQHERGVVECLLALHQPLSALTNATGMIAVSARRFSLVTSGQSSSANLSTASSKNNCTIFNCAASASKDVQTEQWQMIATDWNAYRVEAAWKLGDWSALENYLADYQSPKQNGVNAQRRCYNAFGLSVGGLLSAAQRLDRSLFVRKLDESRRLEMIPATAACLQPEVYVQVYPSTVVRLHMLNDLQLGVEKLVGFEDTTLDSERLESNLRSVVKAWEKRQVRMRPSGVLQESVLEVHRAVLRLAAYRAEKAGWESRPLHQEISSLWLRSAQLAREAGHYQHAYSCLLEAESRESGSQLEGELCLEMATLSWAKGEHMAAIKILDDFINKHASTQRPANDRAMARVRLLHATYSCEACCVDVDAQHRLYKRAAKADQSWEDGVYRLAKSYDEVILTPKCDLTSIMARVDIILQYYCQSLHYGQAHVFHSLPRLLTIFFDLAGQVAKTKDQRLEAKLAQMAARLTQSLSVLRPCIFYAVMGQLVSRIVHPHRRVVELVKELLIKVIAAYPERALWSFFFTTKYENKERQCKARAIIAAIESKGELLREQAAIMSTMTDMLLILCRANLSAKTESLRRVCPALSNTFARGAFAKVVLPTEKLLAVNIDGGAPTDVYFHEVEDQILLLQSLQKPRRITVRGSDGKKYSFLLKAEDDLRKDCRLMEFMGLINRFLAKEPDAYSRKLRIRTYHVSPLDDKCGIIEWVDNLMPLVVAVEEANVAGGFTKLTSRHLAQKIRPEMDKLLQSGDHAKMRELLERNLALFKPSLSYWFRCRFPDAPSWYQAHTLFASSAAVMSMVGFILGLGDRHGENLLIETTCGQVVHVDFNLIFLRGRDLAYPEVVPFRLTQNMIDAMGPTGYEGTFRKCCQVTLKILRAQQDALMSVLSTMVHDPLVEWRNKRKQEHLASNDHPGQRELTEIGYRLNGVFVDRGQQPSARPLSIEGQVALLINEAISLDKLGRMFPGWGPWL
ncbi:serine/threonine-protein kinase ATR-like isoform X2 [Varroa jacobsoni]|uniref:serine/threonine-protein kinase ATR-like isoform X2 n=1 Tax=Varroa jacobsoni TaxID=62625 RepID=UPI000BFA36BA|nr:serine/threonine-protein kinase ATR-like isoform X2 [Varroa jacobsoni]